MNKVTITSNIPDRYEVREAFKTLRTNIFFSGSDIKVIAITSSTQNEGKSFVSFQLAKTMSETGKKVLLIDGDLRKSVLAKKHVDETGMVGLSHYLSGQADLEQVVYGTQYENFNIIFSGPYPPNPVELLGSNKFNELIKHYRDVYDFIIIDTPPLGLVIDAAVIASECDGVIINIAANHVNFRTVHAVKTQLKKSGCNILGAILNMSDISHTYKSYKILGHYYGKYKYLNYYSKKGNDQKQFAELKETEEE